jgi:DNA-binding HxlR family transcriptional regulator
VCSIDSALKVLGERWSLLIVREISFGAHRFEDIVYNTGGPRDVLATRLRTLERQGLLSRRQYSDHATRFEYHLTPAGHDLFGVLQLIRDWGDKHVRDDKDDVVAFTHADHAFRPTLTCAECGQTAHAADVAATRNVRESTRASVSATAS